jgi:hypothetical protein
MSTPSKCLRAPQATSIDTHERREAILKDIENDRGTSAQIARRYGLHPNTIRQLRHAMLSTALAENRKARSLRTAEGILLKLESMMTKVDEDIDAFREYLADPRDPKKLWMGLQAEEVVAHYDQETGEEYKDGSPKTKRRTSQLSELIARLGEEGKSAFEFTIKRDDTRRLYHDAMRLALEVIDRVTYLQKLGGQTNVNVNRTEIAVFFADITEVLKDAFPEAHAAVVARFEEKARALEAHPDAGQE